MSLLRHEGSCSCGNVRIGLLTEPLLKYNCHCSHCRAFASEYHQNAHGTTSSKPYHTGVFVWRWSAVVVSGSSTISYQHTTSLFGLFGLARGRCSKCKDCIWEPGERLAAPYVMIMTPPLTGVEPDTDIFFNSGVMTTGGGSGKSGDAELRKGHTIVYTDLQSWLYQIWIVVTVGLPALPGSLLARLLFAIGRYKKKNA